MNKEIVVLLGVTAFILMIGSALIMLIVALITVAKASVLWGILLGIFLLGLFTFYGCFLVDL